MKLYHFSEYAERRDMEKSTKNIEALLPRLNEPGAVKELKQQVEGWLVLHQKVLQKIAS